MKRLSLLAALVMLAACAEPTTAPTAVDASPNDLLVATSARVVLMDICHYDMDFDRFNVIQIPAPAEPDHRAHGDGVAGEPVTAEGYQGKVFGADCQPADPPPSPCATNSIGMAFARIEAGTFQMGQEGIATPVHEVTITRDFCLGTYEVTQGQWRAVLGEPPIGFGSDACPAEVGDNCPVEQVSWNDAQAFITALNAAEGTTAYRLPTEAEWEYAARAGTTTEWSWGSFGGAADTYAWYSGNAGATTHPVGQKAPNAWGLYDVHGNVSEWVQDWYGAYPEGAVSDPTGPFVGTERVYRGGGWASSANDLRSATRGQLTPGSRDITVGFRVLRAAS